ncbi:glycosyltransferase [Desulfobulbus rhabdoformis]|uniref:glycosyltransferase n=1 Tax=Desulfobulbus rhabdoformis TaxID=34032 RepID=UPI0019646D7B|nr:glycosyltransferase [Desulfobulbus rhabdoformis]MBM9613656.1 glycosyltransferase [Desulfobulbus rhabdoformis]
MNTPRIAVQLLGQSGCRLCFGQTIIYIDPYLSNSVQELDAPDLERLQPPPFPPESVTDATWVLLTHDHLDHCDPHTLPILAQASPNAQFVAPAPAQYLLHTWDIPSSRVQLAKEEWYPLGDNIEIKAVPAAHPNIERDSQGRLQAVGYLLKIHGQCMYLAGDTSICDELLDALRENLPIHTAIVPVNESNFFLDKRGIIGNMSIREAMLLGQEIGLEQLIPVHWDMFACNSVPPEEIVLVHKHLNPKFRLVLNPTAITLGVVNVSIVIRTLNEALHLDALLTSIANQIAPRLNPEVVLVDSGSTDSTLEIAHQHGCRICTIDRADFSFGRSLNIGCDAARGDILVFISGHCIPTDDQWLSRLCAPLLEGKADYVHGGQIGDENTRFSESRIFAKYFPPDSRFSSTEFYCNNANSAITRNAWHKFRFDEELTGLEDMDLAQKIIHDTGTIGYVAEAKVMHLHHESWSTVRRRFEREAIALQKIMPQVHVGLGDMLRYFMSSVAKDCLFACTNDNLKRRVLEIVLYRWNQYFGTYLGNRELRKLSHAEKEKYFYPV